MSYHLVLHPEAANELEAAAQWYEAKQKELGKRFVQMIDNCLAKITEHPQYFHFSRKPFREAVVAVFPYSIVYKVNHRGKTIFISAIHHHKQNPRHKYRKL